MRGIKCHHWGLTDGEGPSTPSQSVQREGKKKKKRGRAFPRKVEDECTRMSEQREVQR